MSERFRDAADATKNVPLVAGGLFLAGGFVEGFADSTTRVGIGVGRAGKQFGLTVADVAGTGFELTTGVQYDLRSDLGKRYMAGGSWSEVGQDMVSLSGQNLKTGLTFGTSELAESGYVALTTGDYDQLSERSGGVIFGNAVGIVGAKVIPGGNPTINTSWNANTAALRALAPSAGAMRVNCRVVALEEAGSLAIRCVGDLDPATGSFALTPAPCTALATVAGPAATAWRPPMALSAANAPMLLTAGDSSIPGVDLALRYKAGWTTAQRMEAAVKVQILNDAETFVTQVHRMGTSAAHRYRQAGGTIPAGADVDHMIDLQLGGGDILSNMWPLNSSVNRSLGRQIQWQIRNLSPGTRINIVVIGD